MPTPPQERGRLFDLAAIFPDPDTVGTTEYLAVHEMVSGAGHLEGAVSRETALHVCDMLSSLIEVAREKKEGIHAALRRSPA